MHKNHNAAVSAGEDDFPEQVLAPTCPVLVAFLAAWSRPCKVMDSVIDKIAGGSDGKARFIKINADQHPALSLLYDVQSLPTLLFFLKGTIRDRLVGTVSTKAVLFKLHALMGCCSPKPANPRPRRFK